MPQGELNVIGGKMFIALGGNAPSAYGGPFETVTAAVEVLRDRFGEVTLSNLYQTPAFPAESGPDFVNAVCALQSDLSPDNMIAALHRIEADFGRLRDVRWGQRVLDLDLIAIGTQVLPDAQTQSRWRDLPFDAQKTQAPDQLILPHPRLQDRSFVLVPLADIDPGWVHPLLGLSVAQMRDARPAAERAEIKAL